MPATAACRREVESLHEFFVDWYAGTISQDSIERLEDALDPHFTLVAPDGRSHTRESVLKGIDGAYARDEPGTFAIDIRNLECRWDGTDHALVRYEEWHEREEGVTGRVSTALLRSAASAPTGLAWVDLHETWLAGHAGESGTL